MASVLAFPGNHVSSLPQAASACGVGAFDKLWYSAQELADARLPGVGRDKRKVNEQARAERWAFRIGPDGMALARSRTGRGGGIEYHVDVLPMATRAALIQAVDREPAKVVSLPTIADKSALVWQAFERQSDSVKAEAARRLAVIEAVAATQESGVKRSAAVSIAAGHYHVSAATLWNWLKLIDGCPQADWLPYLAPMRAGGGREADVDPALWQLLISDWLRPEKPTWESCYWRAFRTAEANGLTLPCSRTLYRKMERDIDPLVVIKRRDGREAHARTMPAQIRTVRGLNALDIVNIDGHRWDVFVRWPDGRIARPMMVAIQDVMSRKTLAWRFDESENAVTTRLCFADLFRDYGIPKACLLDNGRAFASKWITGGAKTRFRFKIKPDDPTGLLPALGINPKWATPYHGQAKPIERAFKDYCDAIAKHPAFSGAYTGNAPNAKPENYGNAAVDLDLFVQVVSAEIEALNAKQGRRTEMAAGRSFDDAFNESYAVTAIGKASAAQLRLALLTADDRVRTNRQDGSIMVHGNKYWSPELAQISGQLVTVRFDPDNLHSEIHVYKRTGAFLCTVPVWEAAGFADADAAVTIARRRSQHRLATKKAEDALDLLTAAQVTARLASVAPDVTPEPAIIRPVRHRGQTAAALRPNQEASEKPIASDLTDRFANAFGNLRLVE